MHTLSTCAEGKSVELNRQLVRKSVRRPARRGWMWCACGWSSCCAPFARKTASYAVSISRPRAGPHRRSWPLPTKAQRRSDCGANGAAARVAAAEQRLRQQAMDGGNVGALEFAICRAKESKMHDQLVAAAEQRLAELVAEVKGKQEGKKEEAKPVAPR